MAAKDKQPIIVVKRIKKGAHGHHGGAWKIAYADFVTAMMAFFLLMWLLGSTTKGDLQGIADYFKTPLKVALQGGSGAGDASSILQGGGKDLTRKTAQIREGETEVKRKRTINLEAARAEIARQDALRLKELKVKLEGLIDSSPALKPYKRQMLLDLTEEGLRIQIVDELNRPMFGSGSADLQSYTREILREIGRVLNEVPNRVSLSGHTDATPYSGGERFYSNWELSADRANASRREMVAGGLQEGRLLRVVGLGAAVPYVKDEPASAMNRRISIIVMNRKTEEAITRESQKVELAEPGAVTPEALTPAAPGAPPTNGAPQPVAPANGSAGAPPG
ncbi:Motility protein B [Burkholderiales bacterium]|nr:Motility protein B [Burkholderiales bacterium]